MIAIEQIETFPNIRIVENESQIPAGFALSNNQIVDGYNNYIWSNVFLTDIRNELKILIEEIAGTDYSNFDNLTAEQKDIAVKLMIPPTNIRLTVISEEIDSLNANQVATIIESNSKKEEISSVANILLQDQFQNIDLIESDNFLIIPMISTLKDIVSDQYVLTGEAVIRSINTFQLSFLGTGTVLWYNYTDKEKIIEVNINSVGKTLFESNVNKLYNSNKTIELQIKGNIQLYSASIIGK